MTQQIINYDEEMVGANHPTKSDTLSRAFLISHANTGGMKGAVADPGAPENYQFYWRSDTKVFRLYNGATWQTVGFKLATGTYTGDGNATKAITGVGFQPTLMMAWRAVTGASAGFKTNQDAAYTTNTSSQYFNDNIISLNADGFTVGDGTGGGDNMNIVGQVYNYACLG